eukprot:SAG11_NODE_2217_length_3678_cov_5.306510_3_plen_238_part_00
MTRRIAELEALVEELRHMIAIRDKELARLRMRLSALQMKINSLDAEIERCEPISAGTASLKTQYVCELVLSAALRFGYVIAWVVGAVRGVIGGLNARIAEMEAENARQLAELEQLRAWKEMKLEEERRRAAIKYVDAGMVAREPVREAAAQTMESFPHEELERLRSLTKLQEQKLTMAGNTDYYKEALIKANQRAEQLEATLTRTKQEQGDGNGEIERLKNELWKRVRKHTNRSRNT